MGGEVPATRILDTSSWHLIGLATDRNSAADAAERFKEIVEAYEVLTDNGRQFRSIRPPINGRGNIERG